MKKPLNIFVFLCITSFIVLCIQVVYLALIVADVLPKDALIFTSIIGSQALIATIVLFPFALNSKYKSIHVYTLSRKKIFFAEILVPILGQLLLIVLFTILIFDIEFDYLFVVPSGVAFLLSIYMLIAQMVVFKKDSLVMVFRNKTVKVVKRTSTKGRTLFIKEITISDIEFNDGELTIKIKDTNYIFKIKTREQFNNYKSQINYLFK